MKSASKQCKFAALFGPAASILEAARSLAAKRDRLALLFDGDPGVGKTALADRLALEITGSAHAIETVNGQSLGIELVREWRERSCYGNLFSAWTVKRIDEIDRGSDSSMAEMLTYLDTLPARHAVIATTNEFAKLRAATKGRLESRFIRLPVDAPTVAETTRVLVRRFHIPADKAQVIARGAVPDGMLDGCNVRAAFHDAEALVAIIGAARPLKQKRAVCQIAQFGKSGRVKCRYCGQPSEDASGVCNRCDRRAA